MLLACNNVGYRYDRKNWLFRNVRLSVQAGEVVGIMGPSGCGKSTLARIIAGFLPALEGEVRLLGQQHNVGAGFHPAQLILQHPEKAVNPRWQLARTLREGGEPDAALLEQLGIQQAWLKSWPNELSAGQLQRICITRGLHADTKLLIADEMTTMLDAITQVQIWQVVLEIVRSRGIGLLAISHDAMLLSRICDRVLPWEELQQYISGRRDES